MQCNGPNRMMETGQELKLTLAMSVDIFFFLFLKRKLVVSGNYPSKFSFFRLYKKK